MWHFLSRNKEVTAMVSLLAAVALLTLILSTRSMRPGHHEELLPEPEDISTQPDIFLTKSLPSNNEFMPSVGNGHIATNVFSDTVYMNGLYNGRKGESHRARIPAWANVLLRSTLNHVNYAPAYSLHTKTGIFHVHVDRERSIVNQRIYAHRYYTRALINQIIVTAKAHVDPNLTQNIRIYLAQMPGPSSHDIRFHEPRIDKIDGHYLWNTCGKTMVLEDKEYQDLPSKVCVYWTQVPDHLVVPRHGTRTFTFAMTVDKNATIARKEMLKVLQEDSEVLFEKHVRCWQKMYEAAEIIIEGNLQLAKIVNGIWYYFHSSLPSSDSFHSPDAFYGLSPGGLARGGLFEDYEGHSFWDTEFWMFPPILVLYPKYAESLLKYRLETVTAAANYANETKYMGYRFPWESAFTGVEVTQPCCPQVAMYEHHVTACIAFAIRQYLAVTGNIDWLKSGGCEVVTKIAEFWESRAELNLTTGLYDIKNVMGPDENHWNITNSAFTNVVAGYSLYLAQYVSCLCQDFYSTPKSEHWADVAWSLALPYDREQDYHPQFEGYQKGIKIKQADVVLLGFPLMYSMKKSTRQNDLNYYESVTSPAGPAMTWSMHTIGHLRLDDTLKAANMFRKSYVNNVREPFKVWSEYTRPKVGAVNFMTGMGGFLQSLIFGYAGVSIQLDRLEIANPRVPPNTTHFIIKGIRYLGANLTIYIDGKNSYLRVHSVDSDNPLTITQGKETSPLLEESTVVLDNGVAVISASKENRCPLPADAIGHKSFKAKPLITIDVNRFKAIDTKR